MTTIQDTDVKVAKRKSVTLTAGSGDKAMKLTILARRTGGDGGETTVTTIDAKTKKALRGMTQKFDTFDEAVLRSCRRTRLRRVGNEPSVQVGSRHVPTRSPRCPQHRKAVRSETRRAVHRTG